MEALKKSLEKRVPKEKRPAVKARPGATPVERPLKRAAAARK
jgi:hypothetical protein